MVNVCVLSGRYPATEFMSPENHSIYCGHHGYHYINCNWPTAAKNPYLHKFYYISHYIDLFDYIFWIDDDAFFLDIQQPLEAFIPKGENFISICKSPANKAVKTVFSSGQFMINCKTGKAFVHAVCNGNLSVVKTWWKPQHGLFTNGDQDIMVYLYYTNPAFINKFELYNHNAFNSRVKDYEESTKVFIIHFTGTRSAKIRAYKKLQAAIKTNGSLIGAEYQQGLKIIDTTKISYQLSLFYTKAKNLVKAILLFNK